MNENEPLTKAEIEAALPLPQSRAVAEAVGLIERAYDDALDARDDRSHYPRWRNVNYLTKRDYRAFAIRLLDLHAAQATPAEGAERAAVVATLAAADRLLREQGELPIEYQRRLLTLAHELFGAHAQPPAPTDGADVGEADVRRALDAYWDAYNSEMVRSLEPGLAHPAGIGAAILADRAARPHLSASREFAACPDLGPIGLDEAPS